MLHRKNALFYRTLHGAEAGDLFMSLIHTCELAGANPFDYLTQLQRHASELAENPSAWMPWNYLRSKLSPATIISFRPASLSYTPEMPRKQAFPKSTSSKVFGHPLRVGLYARVSTHDQQTLPLQIRAMREYAAKRGWTIVAQIKEVGSGASQRELRATLTRCRTTARNRCRAGVALDRWGRSVADLVSTLQELQHLGVGFVSLTEALDLTTPAGRAMAGLLAVFAEFEREILRERVRAGLAHARQTANASAARPRWFTKPSKPGNYTGKESANPKSHAGFRSAEPPSAASWPKRNPDSGGLTQPCRKDTSKSEIARKLEIGRTSVRRLLAQKKSYEPPYAALPEGHDSFQFRIASCGTRNKSLSQTQRMV